jgi:hypothetical protein
MPTAKELRAKAAQCRRLAGASTDSKTIVSLLELAKQYEREADEPDETSWGQQRQQRPGDVPNQQPAQQQQQQQPESDKTKE